MRLIYDGDCGVCERFAQFAARRAPDLHVLPARGLEAVQFEDQSGAMRSGASAINSLLGAIAPRYAPLLRMVEGFGPLFALERAAYAAFAANRGRISRLIGARACGLNGPER